MTTTLRILKLYAGIKKFAYDEESYSKDAYVGELHLVTNMMCHAIITYYILVSTGKQCPAKTSVIIADEYFG